MKDEKERFKKLEKKVTTVGGIALLVMFLSLIGMIFYLPLWRIVLSSFVVFLGMLVLTIGIKSHMEKIEIEERLKEFM